MESETEELYLFLREGEKLMREQNAVRREVLTRFLDKDVFFAKYLQKHPAEESCSLCPYYGKRWSCPPGLPGIRDYLEKYESVCLVVLKVSYPAEICKQSENSKEYAEKIREAYYETAKKELLLKLLELERKLPGSKALGAGRCILCEHCTREEGRPCRNPELRRFSITGFGIEFAELMEAEFQIPLLWKAQGLPEYDVAAAALFLPKSE